MSSEAIKVPVWLIDVLNLKSDLIIVAFHGVNNSIAHFLAFLLNCLLPKIPTHCLGVKSNGNCIQTKGKTLLKTKSHL